MGFFDTIGENYERSRKTSEFRRKAREYVDRGQEIYSDAYTRVMETVFKTKDKMYEQNRFKQNILHKLDSQVKPVIQDFGKFNIEERVIQVPEIDASQGAGFALLENNMSSVIMSPSDTYSRLSDILCSDDDYYEAQSKMYEAKQFRETMKLRKEELYSYRERLKELWEYMYQEQSVVNALTNKVLTLTDLLKQGMNKTTFTKEEADHLKVVNRIAQKICDCLTSEFINKDMVLTDGYKAAFANIERINNAIPDTPQIAGDFWSELLKMSDLRVY